MNPSLFTSVNWACHAVDGSGSPPITGWAGVTPRRSAMSRNVGCVGPRVSDWRVFGPWLVR